MVAKAAPRKVAPKTAGSGDTPEPEPKVFTWKPVNGGDPIVLPHASAAVPKGKALRFFYQMNKRQGDLVGQVVFALDAASVPEPVKDRIFDLDDDEIVDLVSAWTAAISGGASVGES